MSLPCRNGVCITKDDLQVVHDGANFEMTYQYADDEIAKLSVGEFMNEVHDFMLNGTYNRGPIYALFAAHDFTIAQLFQALHLGIRIWPPYASHVTFEMWKQKGTSNLAVRVLYNGQIMNIPECKNGVYCTEAEYSAILKRLKVTNYAEACL